MKVHIVTDTKGAGRVVGVFSDEARAADVCAVDPAYFRMFHLLLDHVNPAAIEWLPTSAARSRLSALDEAQ